MEHLLAKMDDVTAEKLTKVDFFGRPAFVYKEGEKVIAGIDVCTHLGGPLELQNGQLQCQWHGACFARDTGKATALPAPPQSKLIRLPTRVRDGGVYYVTGQ
jgi:nitrite reductase/ring-hydroxylating ferredoxin subunit